MSLVSLIICIPLAMVVFLSAIVAMWWHYKKSRSTSSAKDELQSVVARKQSRILWSSGLLAGLTSIAGIVVAGLIITGIFSLLPTSEDPGSASGIGLAIGMLLCGFGGIWIIGCSIFGAWLHRRFTGSTSTTRGLLIGLINGGLVGIAFIVYSSLFSGFSMSDMLYTLITSAFDVLIVLFPSVIGGFIGGVLFQKNTDKNDLIDDGV